MNSVFKARPYRQGAMGSLGDGSLMLIRQFRFPDTYEQNEQHILVDHDRLCDRDYEKVDECFRRHTGTGELRLEHWVRNATDQQVLDFIQDLLARFDLKTSYRWTGYRVVGSVHRGNGAPVWSLELFAKDPAGSRTKVFSGTDSRDECVED